MISKGQTGAGGSENANKDRRNVSRTNSYLGQEHAHLLHNVFRSEQGDGDAMHQLHQPTPGYKYSHSGVWIQIESSDQFNLWATLIAEDTALMTQLEKELQAMMDVFCEAATVFGLTISIKKGRGSCNEGRRQAYHRGKQVEASGRRERLLSTLMASK
jgi:hypothetical protein